MRYAPRATTLLLASLCALAMPVRATAALETGADASTLRLAAPATISAGSFTLYAWVHREASGDSATRSVIEIPGSLSVVVTQDGAALGALAPASGGANLAFLLPGAIPADEWTLLTLSIDAQTGGAFLAAQSDSAGFVLSQQTGAAPLAAAAPTGDLTLGATGTLPAMRGVYGLVVVRDHAVTPADAQSVFATRQHFAPFEFNNAAQGGAMTGPASAEWMINHAIVTQPINATGINYSNLQLAAQVDNTARLSDFTVFSRLVPSNPGSFRTVRTVSAVESMTYRSPFEISPGWFQRRIPGIAGPLPPNPVAAISPRARRLAEGVAPESDAPMRVLASANSRGVKNQDGVGNPATFAHGFTLALTDRVAGTMLRPARTSFVGPYFGLRSSTSSSERLRFSPDCQPSDSSNLSRFFTGHNSPATPGPGEGVRLPNPGSFYSMRARPEQGSLLRADRRLHTRVYLLAYPGASSASVYADTGPSQIAQGTQAYLETRPLDTASPARTVSIAATLGALALELPGNLAAGSDPILPGMAVSIADGPARSAMSVVSAVEYTPVDGVTRVTFEHPLEQLPAPGDTALFGEYRIETVDFTHDAAAPGFEWRGLEIRHEGDATSLGVVVLAFDAFNPDDGGFVFGGVGWSGNGYDRQLDRAFRDATPRWIAASQTDLWLQFIAHQNSSPTAMTRFLETIRAASPTTETAWIGCVEYESTNHSNWQRYILENAKVDGVVGLTVLTHPTMGSFLDAYADGIFIDAGHITGRGNRKVALAAMDMLRSAARWPGDANNDGTVSFADLNLVLSNLGSQGPSDGSLPGDVNLDGAVNFADLNGVLSRFGSSVND